MATVDVAGLSGVATAHPPDEIRFCGCSQVCVDSEHSYRIIHASEAVDGFSCRIDPGTDEIEETSPGCFEAGEDEKVIGVLGGNRHVYWNPNRCAQTALDAVSLDDCEGCVDDTCSSRVTYDRVGRHEYEVVVEGDTGPRVVTVRTRKCKPPSKWRR